MIALLLFELLLCMTLGTIYGWLIALLALWTSFPVASVIVLLGLLLPVLIMTLRPARKVDDRTGQ